jgi:hypothetical protein
MALKRLTTEEMVQLSSAWVRSGSPARAALLGVDELAGLVPRIEKSHTELVEAQPDVKDPRLAVLMRDAAAVDLRHDGVIRGVEAITLGYSLLIGDDPRATLLKKLREVLLPDGLDAIQKTYRAEAGAAELLKTRLAKSPDVTAALATIAVFDRTLSDYVGEWIACAERLGDLENERASLVKAPGAGDGARLFNARNRWIRAVNALVANAALAELDPATDTLILGALRLAEAIADRRVPSASDEAAGAPAPAKDAEPA